MTVKENKEIIRQYYVAFNKGGRVPFEEYFAENFVDHNGYPDQAVGPDGVREGYEVWIKAFPDNQAELADIVAEGDKVVVRTIATATHLGEFLGIASTKEKVRVEGISIYRMCEGKIEERWGLTVSGELQRILGGK